MGTDQLIKVADLDWQFRYGVQQSTFDEIRCAEVKLSL